MPPREIELKLELPAEEITHLVRSAVLKRTGKPAVRPKTMVSVYYDTDTLKLRKKGFSLRVRSVGRSHVQTIKQEDAAKTVLFDRREWERPIRGNAPELDSLDDDTLKSLLSEKIRERLKPIFETRISRRVFPIRRGKDEVTLTIDKGEVAAGNRTLALCEVELELKRGHAKLIFDVARRLAAAFPVSLALRSKSERGYALIADEKLAASKAAAIRLYPQSTRQDAFQAIVQSCLHQLIINKPVMESGDPEGLHQMRVALRRLRAAFSLFKDMLQDLDTERIKAELKWLARELAPTRELDVFIKEVVKPAARGKAPGIARLLRDLRRKRRQAFAQSLAAVQSERFRQSVIEVLAFALAGKWNSNSAATQHALRQQPISIAAVHEIKKRRRKILRKGGELDELTTEDRHRLRIQAKKLRYASEFFASVFAGKRSSRRKHFVRCLEELQDSLGALNDIAVHKGMTERLVDIREMADRLPTLHAPEVFAAGHLSGREEVRFASAFRRAESAYRRFSKAKPFW